jgi:Spy/CpxP family protein refolding chaperone
MRACLVRTKGAFNAKHGAIDMNTIRATVIIGAMLVTGAVTFGSSAQAAPDAPLSDSDFMTASRCAGLAQGLKLDTAHIESLLKVQAASRLDYIADRADTLRSDEARKASHATGAARSAIDAELAGRCQIYLKGAS